MSDTARGAGDTASGEDLRPTVRILGTHGVPAAYGGFETAAENVALFLVEQGWRVVVYCQADGDGPIHEDTWHGVERVTIPVDAEGWRGTSAFDLKSIRHALRHRDVCLTFGYNTARLQRPAAAVERIPHVINMDGIEWSRSRWGLARQAILYANERIACFGRQRPHRRPSRDRALPADARAPAARSSTITYGAHRGRRRADGAGPCARARARWLRHADLPTDPRELDPRAGARVLGRRRAGSRWSCSATTTQTTIRTTVRSWKRRATRCVFLRRDLRPRHGGGAAVPRPPLPARAHGRGDQPVAGRGHGRRQPRPRARQRLQPLGRRRDAAVYFRDADDVARTLDELARGPGAACAGMSGAARERHAGGVHLGARRRPVREGAAPRTCSDSTIERAVDVITQWSSSGSARWACPTWRSSTRTRTSTWSASATRPATCSASSASTPGCDVHRLRADARRGRAGRWSSSRRRPALHAPMVRAALERDVHVFCEKPFCLDADEGAGSPTLRRDARPGDPGRLPQPVRRRLPGGRSGCSTPEAIGEVTHVLAEAYGPVVLKPQGGTWRSQRSEGGGCLYDYAAHPLNLVNWYLGEPVGVGGTVLNSVFSREIDDEVFEHPVLPGRRDRTALGQLVGRVRPQDDHPDHVWGTAGRIYADRQECQVYLRDGAARAEGYEQGWNVRVHDRAHRAGPVLPARRGVQRPARPLRRVASRQARLDDEQRLR